MSVGFTEPLPAPPHNISSPENHEYSHPKIHLFREHIFAEVEKHSNNACVESILLRTIHHAAHYLYFSGVSVLCKLCASVVI